MALSAKLQLRQSQSLVMTPQLMQSIKLLQFTHTELERFIDDEIERNPLLERIEAPEDAPDQFPKIETQGEANPATSEDWFEGEAGWSSEAISEKLDTSLENLFPDDPGAVERMGPDLAMQWKSASPGSSSGGASEGFDMEDMAAAAITLRDHVGEQISFAFVDPAERLVASELTDWLDEAGYFRGETDEIAVRFAVDEAFVQRVLVGCQGFDPAGLFARDLAECLRIQLVRRDRLDPAMAALIDNLDLLAKRDFQSLKRLCGVDEEDLLDMLAEIRRSIPGRAAALAARATDTIVPDVEVRRPDGSWRSSSTPTRCRGCWSTRSISPKFPRLYAEGRGRRQLPQPNACRTPTG
jgi:RNA polymerase sigma-54 factor